MGRASPWGSTTALTLRITDRSLVRVTSLSSTPLTVRFESGKSVVTELALNDSMTAEALWAEILDTIRYTSESDKLSRRTDLNKLTRNTNLKKEPILTL